MNCKYQSKSLLILICIPVLLFGMSHFALKWLASNQLASYGRAIDAKEEYQGVVLDTAGVGSLVVNLFDRSGIYEVESISLQHKDRQLLQRVFSSNDWTLVPPVQSLRVGFDGSGSTFRLQLAPRPWVVCVEVLSSILGGLFLVGLVRWLETRATRRAEQHFHQVLGGLGIELAHDIRSPVAAIRTLANMPGDLTDAEKLIISRAASRVEEIAESMMTKFRGHRLGLGQLGQQVEVKPATNEGASFATMLTGLVEEKGIKFRHLLDIKLSLDIRPEAKLHRCENADIVARVVSNLIDNAYEALSSAGLHQDGNSGMIMVRASLESDQNICIEIEDNGPGLPDKVYQSVIGQIGTESILLAGQSSKPTGNGIGLLAAKRNIESIDGEFIIRSKSGEGVVVKILLPAPSNMLPVRSGAVTCTSVTREFVLLEDDPWVQDAWLEAAKRQGCQLKIFDGPGELRESLDQLSKEAVFFIDYELGDDALSGLDVARELVNAGYRRVYMASAHDDGRFAGNNFLAGVLGKDAPDFNALFA